MNQVSTSQIRKTPSRISTLIPAVAVLIAGCSSTPKDAAAAPRQQGGGTKRVSIIDPQRGMSAASIEIPSGWKFAGLIVSTPGCHGATDSMAFTAEAQDGVTSIARLPGVRWTVTPPTNPLAQMQVKKCPPVNITTATAFLRNLAVPNMHPGAKIEAELPPLPEGQAALAKQLAQMQQQVAHIPAAFGQRDVTLEGARIRIAYNRNGQPVEEMLTVVISCNTNPQLGRTCVSRGITIARAPKGKLDGLLANPEISHIGTSVEWNPQWEQRKEQEQVATNERNITTNNAEFAQRQAANQAQFNQMIAGARAQDAQRTQNFENAMAGDRAKQAAIDASAHNTVNYSLDRKDYINPNTGQTITASNEYNHQWVNSNNDTLVQTNNPSFDPNGVIDPVRESWTELVPK